MLLSKSSNVQELRDKILSLSNEVKLKKSEYDDMKQKFGSELSILREANVSINRDYETLSDKYEKSIREGQSSKEKQQDQIELYITQIQELKDQTHDYQITIENLNNELDKQRQAAALGAEGLNQEWIDKIGAKDRRIEELESDLQILGQQYDIKVKDERAGEKTIGELKDQVKMRDMEMDKLKKKLGQTENELSQSITNINNLKSSLDSLNDNM